MNKALRKLRVGLSYARADYNPHWYDMGPAEKAMAVYPPMVAWCKSNPGVDWKQAGGSPSIDDKALELAETHEFQAFLVEMFPEEEEPEKAEVADKTKIDILAKALRQIAHYTDDWHKMDDCECHDGYACAGIAADALKAAGL